jgi:hypothetical protein
MERSGIMAVLLTTAQVKALRDNLGDDLADFFAEVHGVEDDVNEDGDRL